MIDLKQQADFIESVCLVRDSAERVELFNRYKKWLETNDPEMLEIEKMKKDEVAAELEGKNPEERAMLQVSLSAMRLLGIPVFNEKLTKMNDAEIQAFCRTSFAEPEKKDPQVQEFHRFFTRQTVATAKKKAVCAKAIEERKQGWLNDCPTDCPCQPLTPEQIEKKKQADEEKKRIETEKYLIQLKAEDLNLWAVTRIKVNCEDGLNEILRHHKEWLNAQAKDEYGTTPLLAAVATDRYEFAKRLLMAGADPNIANKSKTSPLIVAVRSEDYYPQGAESVCGRGEPTAWNRKSAWSLEAKKKMAELLLEYGANPYQVGKSDLNAIEESEYFDRTKPLAEMLKKTTRSRSPSSSK